MKIQSETPSPAAKATGTASEKSANARLIVELIGRSTRLLSGSVAAGSRELLLGQASPSPEPPHAGQRGARVRIAEQQVDHVVVAGVDDRERLRERVDRTDAEGDPPPARLPRERDDEEEAEEGVPGMQGRNRRIRVRVDQLRHRDRVVSVRP